MKRTIIAFGDYYHEFKASLDNKVKEKLMYVLSLLETQDRLPRKFIKLIRDALYELRFEYHSNIYRVFFIFDNDKVVVLFNGFQKKSQKTPKNEIELAFKIKKQYDEYKQQNNQY